MLKYEPLKFGQLVDWVEGRLSAAETAVISMRVAQADEETKRLVQWIRKFHDASKKIVFPKLPPENRRILQQKFKQYVQEQRPSLWENIVATLRFDSHQQMRLAPARAVAEQTHRQIIYATDSADIALHIEKTTLERMRINGQIFASDEEVDLAAFAIQLFQGAHKFQRTATDELGEFTFESIPAGIYDIILSGEEVNIFVSSVDFTV